MVAINYMDTMNSEELALPVPRIDTEIKEGEKELHEEKGGYSDLLEDIHDSLPELELIRSQYSAAVINYDEACFSDRGRSKWGKIIFRILFLLFSISSVAGALGYIHMTGAIEPWHLVVAGVSLILSAIGIIFLTQANESDDVRQTRKELEASRELMAVTVQDKLADLHLLRDAFEQEVLALERQIRGKSIEPL